MGFLDIFKPKDINQGIEKYNTISDAVLLDVRSEQEYKEGHIPGSKNVPLQTIDRAASIVEKKEIPIYTYCYSGSRSSQAVSMLKRMGYTNVINIGGIATYTGKVER